MKKTLKYASENNTPELNGQRTTLSPFKILPWDPYSPLAGCGLVKGAHFHAPTTYYIPNSCIYVQVQAGNQSISVDYYYFIGNQWISFASTQTILAGYINYASAGSPSIVKLVITPQYANPFSNWWAQILWS